MSEMSNILEIALKHKNLKEIMDDEKKSEEYLMKRSAEEDNPYELPKMKYHTKVKVKEMFGCPVVIFNESINAEHLILYLHGGAHVNEIDLIHISFCDRLAKKTDATVFAPIYPLAPNHTYDETYPLVENLYDLILKFENPFTIMRIPLEEDCP
ncbi:MAG: alpha/beta hydrolase [Methanobrevibacter sp.]|nr:alpha/beta hydrolase [Methanobrevibacter sp.]